MDVKTYFDTKRKMTKYCLKNQCFPECPLDIMNNGMHVNCVVLEQDYPDKAIEIIQRYIDKEERKNIMKLWWKCPKCGKEVDFTKQISEVFDDDGSAMFDEEKGIYFHTISCECGSNWIMTLSERFDDYSITLSEEDTEELDKMIELMDEAITLKDMHERI